MVLSAHKKEGFIYVIHPRKENRVASKENGTVRQKTEPIQAKEEKDG